MDDVPHDAPHDAERARLEAQQEGRENWHLWGPYLSERAWGTVREDYSADGAAWEHFSFDQAASRAFRWSEDGIAGICDEEQRLIFALALWNGRDPILKERLFGLTGNQGNHGEDVKESYFHLDATPSHSWLRYLYKYPQRAFPYDWLLRENARRSRADPPVSLHDSDAFQDNRYWDVEVRYAKAGPEQILIRLFAANRGPEAATIWLLPTLWFRNTWNWGDPAEKPVMRSIDPPKGAVWALRAVHPSLGTYYLYGRRQAELLFTDNESNTQSLWGQPNAHPYVKDAFQRHLIQGEADAVNPEPIGSKFAASHKLTVAPGETAMTGMVLSRQPLDEPFARWEATFAQRQSEATVFYDELLPNANTEDHRILRQAMAGMIWSKQFFHYDVARWLDGDGHPPPERRKQGRNTHWRHFKVKAVISMPDKWEYPWFAAWDLAFHASALALIDIDFAKAQIELLLKENALHPNGLIPAYEWAFGDANPPVHAAAALKAYRAERVQRGREDRAFLKRVLHKLLLNDAWWINRKDADGHNVFEGGFMGLDNISVFDRSQPLPPGYALKQADATGWMAMFALNLTLIALEITVEDPAYEDIAIQCYSQFMNIAAGVVGKNGGDGLSLWDEADGFYKDLLVSPDGGQRRIDVFSWVGIIPLFACEVVDKRLIQAAPRFAATLAKHGGGGFDGHVVCACPVHENARGEHLLSLADPEKLARILTRVLDEDQFLSRHGVRGVSKLHATRQDLGELPGIGHAYMEYQPGESASGLFGGNSNWRGPIWLPTNYLLIQAIEKYHRYLGASFTVAAPCLNGQAISLKEVANLLAERLVDIFRRSEDGLIPAYPPDSPLQHDPHWRDLHLFHEYFHGETGQGLGAAHQTGWTALIANLIFRRYRQDIPEYWKSHRAPPKPTEGEKP
ncbi:MAG: glucosidase [Pseudomonadota bacterium]|nr:glucosidase [Pseudomonadota bacterium]MDP2352658.1 glucosidase [Pseudomonadota bacterium]